MFSFSRIKSYPLKKYKFYKTISPFFFEGDLFFSGQKKYKSKTSIYKFNNIKKKIECCLVPNEDQRFVSPFIFKYNKKLIMLFENQNKKNKHSQISVATSTNSIKWKIINQRFIYNKNYSIGSPAIIKYKKKNQFLFFFYKKKKNRIKHIFFFKRKLNLKINNYKKNKIIYHKNFCNDYAPFLFKFKNNYFNFFSRWSGFLSKKGLIFFSQSKDLDTWSTPLKVRLPNKIFKNRPKIIHYSEPNVVNKDNNFYLYFEECNENKIWTVAKTKLLQ